jgi:hypothetical protein
VITAEDYRQLAERCAALAKECAEPNLAEALRTLALDYLTRAAHSSAGQTKILQINRSRRPAPALTGAA